jgi:peroxiredoxin
MSRVAFTLGLALTLCGCKTAEPQKSETVAISPRTQSTTISAPMPGITIGETVPTEMILRDSSGAETSLDEQMGANGMVLILVRSADWCPYCKAQLAGLQAAKVEIEKRGMTLATLSYDQPATLAGYAKAKGLSYLMLSDQDSKLIDRLGLRDPHYKGQPKIDGVPFASVLVLAKNGTVRAKNVSLDYTVRLSNADVIAMVDGSKS